MSKLSCGICTALALALAVPSWGVVIIASDDVSFRGGTPYNNTDPFGLFARGGSDRAYAEFALGSVPATSATLRLYNAWSKPSNPVNRDVQITGGPGDFNELTVTEAQINALEAGFVLTTPASDFHVDDPPQWYSLDITDFYNDHRGQTVTLAIRVIGGNGDGPIFVDHEGTSQIGSATPFLGGSGFEPQILVEETTLPDCESLVSPQTTATATAFRNQTASPSSFPYEVLNAGLNSLDYTAVEMQEVPPAIADLYSTGVDNARNALGEQVLDPHWTIIEGGLAGTCSAGSPCPAYTVVQDGFPIPPWLSNSATSMWITPSQTDTDAIAPVGDHVYRTTFTVGDPGSAVLRLRVSADDTLQSVQLNGVDTVPPITTGTGTFGEWHEFTIDSGLQAGANTLDFRVNNGGSTPNPTGLRVEFYDVQPGEVSWLGVNPPGGSIASGNSATVTASIIDTDLPAGLYRGYIGISDDCAPAVTHVRQIELTVIDCRSAVTPEDDTGRAVLIGSAQTPAPVSYTFQNTAVAEVNYAVTTSGDCSWLELDPTSGGPIGPGGSDTVTGTIDPTGVGAGGHVCTLTFTDDCNPAVEHVRDVLLSVDEAITGPPSGLQQFNAEFTTFTGSDLAAQSPLESCDPDASTDRIFSIGYNQVGVLPAGWLTQGSISGTPTTAKFANPSDGNTGRARFRTFLPYDDTYNPAKGMIVAWRMRVGSGDVIQRGPIQITFPRVTGPFGTNDTSSSIPGEVFNCYIRLQDGTDVRILNNGGGAIGTIDELTLATWIADEYHQWTAAVCYNVADQMAYWNLWLEGEKLLFGGADGTVVGPGGDVFSFRTSLDDVTGDPYIGLGELGGSEDVWDFEFDWVRMVTLNVDGCPFWDGQGCIPEPLCPTPFADADKDGDVDNADFGDFQICFTGTNDPGGAYDPATCACYDRDQDDDVDTLDFEKFNACGTGPGIPWVPTVDCP